MEERRDRGREGDRGQLLSQSLESELVPRRDLEGHQLDQRLHPELAGGGAPGERFERRALRAERERGRAVLEVDEVEGEGHRSREVGRRSPLRQDRVKMRRSALAG